MKKKTFSRRDFLDAVALTSLGSLVYLVGDRLRLDDNIKENQPNILILLLDALSARHISLYGYPRETMPNLAKLAEQSTVFHQHHSPGNFTSPATASLLTGTHPWTHRSLHMFGEATKEFAEKNIFSVLPPAYATFSYTHNLMVEMLLTPCDDWIDLHPKMGESGIYDERIASFRKDFLVSFWGEKITRGEHSSFKPVLYLGTLIDMIQEVVAQNKKDQTETSGIPPLNNYEGLSFTLQDALQWIGSLLPKLPSPFFAYTHLFPPHAPFYPTEEFLHYFQDDLILPNKPVHIFNTESTQEYLTRRRREYDQFIAYTDHVLGNFLQNFEDSGLYENTFLIITSDHGEMAERGIWGHLTEVMYEPLLHIPLVIHKPGQNTREDVHTLTSLVDFLPTVCEITGQPVPAWAEGEILPTFIQSLSKTDRKIFSLDAKTNNKFQPLTKGTLSMIQWPYKLIYNFGYEKMAVGFEMYNLEEDTEELNDLYQQMPEVAKPMKDVLLAKLNEVNRPYRE
jgi:arylsulfatase A-like enzyme